MNSITPSISTLCMLFSCFVQVASVQAQLIAPANDGVGTTVQSTPANQFDITGGTRSGNNLFHSFQRFGLNQGQIANFLSTPTIQNILSRVTGGEASFINGRIQVTGSSANLFLINSAGIVFGTSASLNVPAAFTATTANAIGFGSNQWFNATGSNDFAQLNGTPDGFAFLTRNPGAIVNLGSLQVNPGQALTLLGGTVLNTGTIAAPGGRITIAAVAGEKLVRLSQDGSLLSLELPVASQAAIAPPTLTPPSLPELLTGGNLANATAVTVENGVVKLTQSGVAIPSQAGTTVVTGTVQATSSLIGGKVDVLGDRIAILNANLDASGVNGGGIIRIGGDYQGKGTLPTAQQTIVNPDSTIHANALQQGNGGQVIVWADDTTRFQGKISAQGGIHSGNGGQVEVSGKTNLQFAGRVDTHAPQGKPGELVLDPTNITVINSVGAMDDPQLVDSQILFTDGGAASYVISNTTLSAQTANVILQAQNNITFNGPVNLTAPGVGLTAQAGNDITIAAGATLSTTGGIINLLGDADNTGAGRVAIGANLSSNGGAVTLQGTGVNNSGVDLAAGATIASTGGTVTITGASSGTLATSDGVVLRGNILSGAGAVSVTGSTTATGGGVMGVELLNTASINSGGGAINLNGTSTSTGIGAFGVRLQGGVTSAGGTVTIVGTSQPQAESVLVQAPITSGVGAITITGNGSGITTLGTGSINSTGGNISIQNNTSNFWGIALQAPVSSGGGAITLTGNGGTSVDAFGVATVSPIISAGGNITITGTSVNLDGILIGDLVNSGSGNIILTADRVNLNPGGSENIQGSGILTIQPLTPTQNLQVGGNNTTPNTTFLTTGELSIIGGGFNSLIIGRDNSSGLIRLADNLTFTVPVTLRSPAGNGSIDTTGFNLAGIVNANFTLIANQTISTGNVSNPGRTISLTSLNSGINTTTGQLDTSSPITGGLITLRAKDSIQVNTLTAQGGIGGGTIVLDSDRTIRANGIFLDQGGRATSISAAGRLIPGRVTIRHGGLAPFTIGDSSLNGTLGTITDGVQTVSLGTQISNLPGTFSQGGIQITPGGTPFLPLPTFLPVPVVPSVIPSVIPSVASPSIVSSIPPEILVTLTQTARTTLPPSFNPISTNSQPVLPNVVRQQAGVTLDNNNPVGAIGLLEQAFQQEYRVYFGVEPNSQAKTARPSSRFSTQFNLQEVQTVLENINAQTSFKPAIIYIFSRPEQLDLILIPPTGKPIYRSVAGVSSDRLMQEVNAFSNQVTNRALVRTTSYRSHAETLHRWLIAPLEEDLQRLQINTLLFSLDQGLRTLPLAALHDGRSFLVERYSLSVIPSFYLTDWRPSNLTNARVLAIGVSQFADLPPLPAVPVELAAIVNSDTPLAQSLPSTTQRWTGRSFLNQEATVATLQSQLQQSFNVIHLATHANFHPGKLTNSFIQLWDRKLQLSELRQLGWTNSSVELLVLSACQTAVGDPDAELGFAGLTVQTGARSALGSLWAISDEGTLALIQAFYQQLQHLPIKAEALRQAQLELIRGNVRIDHGQIVTATGITQLPPELIGRDQSFNHPYYWSAFTIIGNPW